MNVTYSWKIVALEKDVATGFIVNVHWECIGEDQSGVSGRVYGVQSFSPNPEDPSFIPFENLTEATVLDWVWLNGAKQVHEQKVLEIIDNQLNPKIVSALPW